MFETTMLSVVLGWRWTLLTLAAVAPPPEADDLNVLVHSVVFVFHNFTKPSEEALHTNTQKGKLKGMYVLEV